MGAERWARTSAWTTTDRVEWSREDVRVRARHQEQPGFLSTRLFKLIGRARTHIEKEWKESRRSATCSNTHETALSVVPDRKLAAFVYARALFSVYLCPVDYGVRKPPPAAPLFLILLLSFSLFRAPPRESRRRKKTTYYANYTRVCATGINAGSGCSAPPGHSLRLSANCRRWDAHAHIHA